MDQSFGASVPITSWTPAEVSHALQQAITSLVSTGHQHEQAIDLHTLVVTVTSEGISATVGTQAKAEKMVSKWDDVRATL